MAVKQIVKRSIWINPLKKHTELVLEKEEKSTENETPKKNKGKKSEEMTKEQIEKAAELAQFNAPVKVMKKDRGLIERTESSKIVLAEDNRQLLND